MARIKVRVNQNQCIGCQSCIASMPDDFMEDENGLATTVTGEADESALDVCPVGAIEVDE